MFVETEISYIDVSMVLKIFNESDKKHFVNTIQKGERSL